MQLNISNILYIYTCSKCKYAATSASRLKVHIRSKHKGVSYLCSQCEHIATTANALKKHVESNHDGVRYPCPGCDFASTRASYLKKHVKININECDILEYVLTLSNNLRSLIKNDNVFYLPFFANLFFLIRLILIFVEYLFILYCIFFF